MDGSVVNANGVITAVITTPGDVSENSQLMTLVEQHEAHTDIAVETVVADTQYGTADNFRACHERGIPSHRADFRMAQEGLGRREGIFSEADFRYDEMTDAYICPAGEILTRRKHKLRRVAYEYAASPRVCATCRLRAQCTRAKEGTARSVKRHIGHEAIQAARAQLQSAEAKRDRIRRKWMMEGSFADAVNNHGFKRARWPRLWRQQIQDYMIATVQNIRILLRHAPDTNPVASGVIKIDPKQHVPAAFGPPETLVGHWFVMIHKTTGHETSWSFN